MDRSKAADINAVILDYGEVLCYPPTAEHWGRMASIFKVDPALFRQLWSRNRIRYDRGDLSYEAYWSEIAEEAKVETEPERLKVLGPWDVEMWARINPTMVKWVKQMHSSGVKTALLSNMPHDMISYARQNFAWLNNFDHQTFSAEVGLVKPDPAIYRHSLDGLGAAASEALFVDDRESNIEGARALGIRAIRFQSVAQLKDDLEKLGFPVLPLDMQPSSEASQVRVPD
jgi:putative hydrolase of the HAD superfamily